MPNSHEDLRFNAKRQDRQIYGYNLTCAPLQQSVHDSHTINTTITTLERSNYSTVSYNLGQRLGLGVMVGVSNLSRRLGGNDYNVRSTGYYDFNNGGGGDPIFILIDKSSILYSGPGNGPVFATRPVSFDHNELVGELYRPLELASLMVCAESYQFCNPNNAK